MMGGLKRFNADTSLSGALSPDWPSGGKKSRIVCAEAIRRDLSVYLAVNAVATVPEIYDDPHYGTRSGPSRFKAPKTLETPGDHVGNMDTIG